MDGSDPRLSNEFQIKESEKMVLCAVYLSLKVKKHRHNGNVSSRKEIWRIEMAFSGAVPISSQSKEEYQFSDASMSERLFVNN